MNLTVKRCLWFLVAGGGSGLIILAAFVLVGGVLSKGSLPHTILTRLFEAINKPLEMVPGLGFLAERQDPILSFGFIAVNWGGPGSRSRVGCFF